MEQLFKRYINNHAIRVDQTKAFGYKDQGARKRLGKFAVYRVLVDQATLIAHIRSDDVGFLFYEDRKTTAEWAAMFDQTEFDLPKVPSYSTLYTIYEWVMNYEPYFFLIPEPKRPSTEVRKIAPQPVDDPQDDIDAYNEAVGRLSEEQKRDPYLSAQFNKTGLDLRMRRAKFVARKIEIEETSAHNDGINARNRQKMEKYESEKKAFDDQKKIYWGIAKYVEFVVKERLRLSRGDGILENSLPTITDFDIAESTRNQKLREQMEAKMGPKELSRTMVPAPLPTRPGEEPYVFVPRVEKPATYLPAPMPIESGCHKKIKICDDEMKMGDHHPPPPPDGKTKKPDLPPPRRKDSIIPPPPPPPIKTHDQGEVDRVRANLKHVEEIEYFKRFDDQFSDHLGVGYQASKGIFAQSFKLTCLHIKSFTRKIVNGRLFEFMHYWAQIVSLWLKYTMKQYTELFGVDLTKTQVEILRVVVLNSISLLDEKRVDVPSFRAEPEDGGLSLDYKNIILSPMDIIDIKKYLDRYNREDNGSFNRIVYSLCFFYVDSELYNKSELEYAEAAENFKKSQELWDRCVELKLSDGTYDAKALILFRDILKVAATIYYDDENLKLDDGGNLLEEVEAEFSDWFKQFNYDKFDTNNPIAEIIGSVESEQVYLAADI